MQGETTRRRFLRVGAAGVGVAGVGAGLGGCLHGNEALYALELDDGSDAWTFDPSDGLSFGVSPGTCFADGTSQWTSRAGDAKTGQAVGDGAVFFGAE